MSNLENPPAFPSLGISDDGARRWLPTTGMSLRDYMAAAAATGLLAHPQCGMVGKGYEARTAMVAEEAYSIADAMVAARTQGGE